MFALPGKINNYISYFPESKSDYLSLCMDVHTPITHMWTYQPAHVHGPSSLTLQLKLTYKPTRMCM